MGEQVDFKNYLKINRSKIFELSDINLELLNESDSTTRENFQILYIKELKLLEKFNFESLQNIFVIVVECEINESLLETLKKHFNVDKEIIVQCCGNNFYKVSENKIKKMEPTSLSTRLKFSKEIKELKSSDEFCDILRKLKVSILDVTLGKILKKCNIQDGNLLLKNAMKQESQTLLKLLLLFETSLSTEILNDALSQEEIDVFITILKSFTTDQIKQVLEEILKSYRINEILIKTVEKSDVNSLKILTQDPQLFSRLLCFNIWCEATKIAHSKNFYKISRVLHEVEPNYYSEIYENDKREAESYFTFVETFHKKIQDGELEAIKLLVRKFPFFKICVNSEKICALQTAISFKQFDIYSYLLSEGFLAFDKEKLCLKIGKLRDEEKEEIRLKNVELAKKNPNDYLNILANKCDIFSCSNLSFDEIRDMLEKLNIRGELTHYFRIASHSDVKIVFNFNSESINLMDPNASEFTMGMAYVEKDQVLIGRDGGEYERLGTFAHELAHYVYFLIYENDGLPYCKGDINRKRMWDGIVALTKQRYLNGRDNTVPIINNVFTCYRMENFSAIKTFDDEKFYQSAELAVRVPHIIARYLKNPQSVQKARKTFPELFGYFYKFILPDLQIKNVCRVIKLNNKFKLLKKIKESQLKVKSNNNLSLLNNLKKYQIISSNVPQLPLSQILNEIDLTSQNKLHEKTQNFFVDVKESFDESILIEFLHDLQCADITRIILKVENFGHEFLKLISKCEIKAQIFIVINNNLETRAIKYFEDKIDAKDFNVVKIQYGWYEITEESKNFLKLKRLILNGKEFKVLQIFEKIETISSEAFAMICSSDQIELSFMSLPKNRNEELINYYPRSVLQSNRDISLDDLLEKVKNEKVVLISDVAGSGKTTFLWKVRKVLKEKFSNFLIVFISLQYILKYLSAGIGKSFRDFIADILELNALEKDIFKEKFFRGEVRILFDGFDEISPRCKEETLKLFETFLKQYEKNQIWITTRTHHEQNLENALEVDAYKLKVLSSRQQIEFLQTIWKNTKYDENLVLKNAKLLVAKVKELFAFKKDVIGIPLILEGLANYFKGMDENLEEKIMSLKFYTAFEKIIIDLKFKILQETFKDNYFYIGKLEDSAIKIFQCFAIEHFFKDYQFYDEEYNLITYEGERFASILGFQYDKNSISFEELARIGIVLYDNDWNQKKYFIHEVYAEFFLAMASFYIIRVEKNLSIAQKDFLIEILQNEKFDVVRMFLRDLLREYENKIPLKIP